MQRKKLIIFVFSCLMVLSMIAFSACGTQDSTGDNPGTGNVEHSHTFSNEWSHDGAYHWQACSGCDEVRNKSEHDWNSGIITTAPTETTEGAKTYTCNTCGHTKVEPISTLEHEHTFEASWSFDETYHWHASTCGHENEVSGRAEHTWNSGVVTKEATAGEAGERTYMCTVCGATKTEELSVLEHTHTYSTDWSSDATYHWHTATCGHENEVSSRAEHVWNNGVVTKEATESEGGVLTLTCAICGQTSATLIPILEHTHVYSSEWSYDQESHWHAAACGHEVTTNKEPHDWDEGVVVTEPTETTEGAKLYTCKTCGQTKTGAIGVLDHTHTYSTEWTSDATYHWRASTCGHQTETIGRAEHTWDTGLITKVATAYENGEITYTCEICGEKHIDETPVLFSYRVIFYDFDNTILNDIKVLPGESAVSPTLPEREGYRFYQWDKPYDNVQSDLYIIAQYIRVYSVEFVDYDGLLISSQLVDINKSAIAPGIPERNGYRFIGWDIPFDIVVDDILITAQYVKQYNVTFVGFYGDSIADLLVDEGSSFSDIEKLPVADVVEHYTFINDWDNKFENISSDQTVRAIYEIETFTVSFVMPDRTIIEEQTVGYGFAAHEPDNLPDYYYSNKQVFAFTRWTESFDNISEDAIITAVYETEYEKPVIFVEYLNDFTIMITIQTSNKFGLYALDFSGTYSSNFYLKDDNTANAINVNDAVRWLWDGEPHLDKNKLYSYSINNKTCIFNFAWTNATSDEIKESARYDLFNEIVFTRSDSTSQILRNFTIISSSVTISTDGGNFFEIITPLILYIDKEGNLIV